MKALIVAIVVLFGAGLVFANHDAAAPAASCPVSADAVVAGYSGEQLANAAVIMQTASGMGLDEHAQLLGVMAAMGESGLRNLPYGDWETSGVRNPDGTPTSSIGLFQQQDWWGSPEQRMDPAQSASLFFGRLAGLEGWETMAPSEAIHEVQINSDPDHYARFQDAAEQVTAALRACP